MGLEFVIFSISTSNSSQKRIASRTSETGTGFADAKRILRPVGPQDASLARRLSEMFRLRSRCSLRSQETGCGTTAWSSTSPVSRLMRLRPTSLARRRRLLMSRVRWSSR